MDKLIDYAQNGLPIILYNSQIGQVYGTDKGGNNDTLLQERVATLTTFASTARTENEVLTLLTGAGVQPAASYSVLGLETSHRVADEGFYYYFYNDNENRITPTVTVEGEGVPYFLDAWTGEIVPMAQYTVGSGTVTFDLGLEGKDAIIVALAKETSAFPSVSSSHVTGVTGGEAVYAEGMLLHRATEAGTYTVHFSDIADQTVTVGSVPGTIFLADDWDLTLESWGPTEEGGALSLGTYENDYSIDPTVSEQASIFIEDLSLGTWSDITVTGDQLSTLGVSSMAEVSGIGYYTTSFDLPETWTSAVGAFLQFEHQSDMIVDVTLNGNIIDDIDQFTNTVDVGAYLQAGSNNLEIKLDTTLQNRASSGGNTAYGLTAVTLTPYVQTALAVEYPDSGVGATAATSDSIVSLFQNPDVDAKPMARMWFPDAGAGASQEGLDMVAKQINDMAAGGFGGVEIAFLSDDTRYDNDDAREIGWGSENWRNVLKTILTTANAVENGFKVDITITTHWPPTVNNIDPNDDEAAKEASYAYRKITTDDIAAGKVDVPLPVQKTEDYFSPFGGGDDGGPGFPGGPGVPGGPGEEPDTGNDVAGDIENDGGGGGCFISILF